MAITTTNESLDGDWAIIAESVEKCIVQLASQAPAAIYVGTADPDANSAHVSLSTGGDRSLSLADLTTEKVWARSGWGWQTSSVAVLKG